MMNRGVLIISSGLNVSVVSSGYLKVYMCLPRPEIVFIFYFIFMYLFMDTWHTLTKPSVAIIDKYSFQAVSLPTPHPLQW